MVWEITGAGGGQWTVRAADGTIQPHDGADADADLALRMSPLVFSLLWNGKLDLSGAVANGQIGVSNIAALTTFQSHFPPSDPNDALTVVF